MKRYRAENPSDMDMILKSIHDCCDSKKNRRDVMKIYNKDPNISEEENILNKAKEMQRHIVNRDVVLGKFYTTHRSDGYSGKMRDISSTDMESQIYHWVFVNCVEDGLMKMISTSQCASLRGRGGVYGKRKVEMILKKKRKSSRICMKLDIKSCYSSIGHDVLKYLVRRKIKGDEALWLGDLIIDSFEDGLPIGAYYSQFLCNYVISFIYHYIKEEIREFGDVIIYMDDIVLFGNDKSRMMLGLRKLMVWMKSFLGLNIKKNWTLFRVHYWNPIKKKFCGRVLDFMGYKFYRFWTTIRKKIFANIVRRFRRVKKRLDEKKLVSFKEASGCLSSLGWVKHTNSWGMCNRYIARLKIIFKLKEIVRHESLQRCTA